MWHPSTIALSILLGMLAGLAGFIYLYDCLKTHFTRVKLTSVLHSFGIPPSIKRWIEEQGLEAMGENKASYLAKSAVDKLPEADQDVSSEIQVVFWKRY